MRQVSDYVVNKEISSTRVAELIEWGKNFLSEAEQFMEKTDNSE
jgi:hypothetical protein